MSRRRTVYCSTYLGSLRASARFELFAHGPGHTVGLAQWRDFSCYREALEVDHNDFVSAADGYECAGAVGINKNSFRASAQAQLFHFFAGRRIEDRETRNG